MKLQKLKPLLYVIISILLMGVVSALTDWDIVQGIIYSPNTSNCVGLVDLSNNNLTGSWVGAPDCTGPGNTWVATQANQDWGSVEAPSTIFGNNISVTALINYDQNNDGLKDPVKLLGKGVTTSITEWRVAIQDPDDNLLAYYNAPANNYLSIGTSRTQFGDMFLCITYAELLQLLYENGTLNASASSAGLNITNDDNLTIFQRATNNPGEFYDGGVERIDFHNATDVCSNAEKQAYIRANYENETGWDYTSGGAVDTTAPTITFINQSPADMNSFNIESERLNITYDITDATNVNESTTLLFHKLNSTGEDGLITTNGSITNGDWESRTGTNTSTRWTFLLDDDDVYPATYNYPQHTMESTAHSIESLDANEDYMKIEFFNISNTKEFGFFELMINTSGVFPGRLYYCNATYSTGDPDTLTECTNFFNIPSDQGYNHTHNNSAYVIVPFTFDNITKLIGGVYVNNGTGYFLARGSPGANAWDMFYIAPISREGAAQTSIDDGSNWVEFSGTPDAHLHQFSRNVSLYYVVQACDTLGNCGNSTIRQDLIDIGNLPPIAPDVYNPTAAIFSGNVTINYTAAESPNQLPIINYNITLLDDGFNFVTNITDNTTELGFIWDSTASSDGVYIIKVTALDSQGLSSSGFSVNFTITNVPIVNITTPLDDATLNVVTIWVNATVSSPGASSFICTINNSLWGLHSNTSTEFYFNATSPPEQRYTINITCTDDLNRAGSSLRSFFVDTSAPTITQTIPASDNTSSITNDGSVTFKTKVDDSFDLHSLDINITEEVSGTKRFNYTNHSLSGLTTFTFEQAVDVSSWANVTYLYRVQVCDSSTLKQIPTIQSIVKYDNLTFGYEDTMFTITPLGSVVDSSIKKEIDRYTFRFEYIGESLYKEYLITAKDIAYLPLSKKPGHFVISNLLWVDFWDKDNSKVIVEKIDDNTYKVIVYSAKNIIEFKSVGFLNCEVEMYKFDLVNVTIAPAAVGYDLGHIRFTNWFNTDIFDTATTPGVLLYFFLLMLLVCCCILSEVTRIPASFFMTGLLGFVFGFLILVTVSAIFGTIVILFGALYLGRTFT